MSAPVVVMMHTGSRSRSLLRRASPKPSKSKRSAAAKTALPGGAERLDRPRHHLRQGRVGVLAGAGNQREDAHARHIREEEGLQPGNRRGVVEPQIRQRVPAALLRALRRAAAHEGPLRRPAAQLHVLEGQRRHRRDVAPVAHRRRRRAALLAHPPVGGDAFELVREDLQRQRLERRARRIADEAQDLVVNRMRGSSSFVFSLSLWERVGVRASCRQRAANWRRAS